MFAHIKGYVRVYFLSVFVVLMIFVWYAVVTQTNDGILTVVFLDVGQGDATFIETPDRVQVLIDGGAGRAVLSELGRVMPFYDRSLDIVIATHPDLDHIGGLPAVFDSFHVDAFMTPPFSSDADAHKALLARVESEEVQHLLIKKGTRIALGEEVFITILFPDRDMTGSDPNSASLIARLTYKDTSFLFTGDAPVGIENYLVRTDADVLRVDVLKVGHHGSKTSSSELFVGFVSPEIAIISAGKENRYGHPHQEVLDTFSRFGASVFRTDVQGRVIVESDGETLTIQ